MLREEGGVGLVRFPVQILSTNSFQSGDRPALTYSALEDSKEQQRTMGQFQGTRACQETIREMRSVLRADRASAI